MGGLRDIGELKWDADPEAPEQEFHDPERVWMKLQRASARETSPGWCRQPWNTQTFPETTVSLCGFWREKVAHPRSNIRERRRHRTRNTGSTDSDVIGVPNCDGQISQ